MRVKHISLIRIVNKSSTFNISEFVIVLFYCIAFIIIIIIIIMLLLIIMSQKHSFEVRGNPNLLFICYKAVCLIRSVNTIFMFNISYLS